MKTSSVEITVIDIFPDFEKYWEHNKKHPVKIQLDGWISEYMGDWPDLLRLQVRQYQREGVDWKKVAEGKILPSLEGRLTRMRVARKRLLADSGRIVHNAQVRYGLRFPVILIIYAGIGLGAGWATKYQGKPAILFGLENIAEEGWTSASEIYGLVTHELGHLIHSFWREKAGKRFLSTPLWQLYTEGFADYFEKSLESNRGSHRRATNRETAWFNKNKQWLANEFSARLEKRGDFRQFFGSWYDLRGYSQMGYYLGSEILERLGESRSLQKIALLENVSKEIRAQLANMGKMRP